jgi:hypothetical protein
MAALVTRSDRLALVRLAEKQEKGQRGLNKLAAKLRRQAIAAAARSPELRERFGDRRHRILGGELYILQGGRNLLTALRHGELAVYDYDRDVLVSIIADLQTGKVVRVVEHSRLQPPPIPEEADEAAAIAVEGQSALARKWRARQLVTTAITAREASIEGHPCYGHRGVYVYFWTRGAKARRVAGPILVDLSGRRVLELEQPAAPDETGVRR